MDKRHLAAGLLILAGLALLAAPALAERWADTQQQQMLAAWEQSLTLLDEPQAEAEPEAVSTEELLPSAEEAAGQKARAAYLAEHMVGTLEIAAIELRQPVLDETNEDNLRLALTIVEPSAKPGEAGNFVIAGHNNYGRGRHFNRLEEVALGDELTFTTATESFTYTVTAIDIVEPDDITVLVSKKHQTEITLITCYPQKNPDKRLIVKGVLAK